MRKVLLTLLVAAMVLSFGAMGTAATATVVKAPVFTDIAGADGEFELAALGALGIFSGDTGMGGTVRPADSITRAEFCKVVITAMGKASIATGLAGLTPTFTDGASVPAWAWGFVNAASMMGIINGYADGSFKASNLVTYREAITMLVRAVSGHATQVPAAATWPYNYIWYGLDNGFVGTADLSFPALPCPRGDMAVMTFATMGVDPLDADGDPLDDHNVLAGRVNEGTLLAYSLASRDVDIDLNANGTVETGEHFVLGATVGLGLAPSFEGLRNLPVMAIEGTGANAAKVLFVGATEGESSAFSGWFRDDDFHPAGDTTGYDYLRFWDGTVVPYRLHTPGTGYVDARINSGDLADETDLDGTEYVTVTKNDDGFAVFLSAERDHVWIGAVVDDARAWVTHLTKATTSTGSATVNLEWIGDETDTFTIPYTAIVTINGAAAVRNDLLPFDLVYVGYQGDLGVTVVYVHAIRKSVEGAVTATRTSYPGPYTYCTIGGTEYEFSLDTPPSVGDVVKYGFDRDDIAYVPVSYSVATTYWWVKTYIDVPTQYGDTLGVNIDGSEQTYHGDDGNFSANASYIGCVALDASRRIDTIVSLDYWVDFNDVYGEVLSVDATNQIIVVDDEISGNVIVLNETAFVVYQPKFAWDSATQQYLLNVRPKIAAYVGLANLQPGDYIYYNAAGQVILVHPADVEDPIDPSIYGTPHP